VPENGSRLERMLRASLEALERSAEDGSGNARIVLQPVPKIRGSWLGEAATPPPPTPPFKIWRGRNCSTLAPLGGVKSNVDGGIGAKLIVVYIAEMAALPLPRWKTSTP